MTGETEASMGAGAVPPLAAQTVTGGAAPQPPTAADAMAVLDKLGAISGGRRGFRTSEFAAAVVLPWLVTAADNAQVISLVPDNYRFLLAGFSILAGGFYALSRGQAKRGSVTR